VVQIVGGRISQCANEVAWQASTRAILWGVALILLGILGASLLLGAVSVNLVVAWLIVLAGLVQLITEYRVHRAGSLVWRLMIAFAYVLLGVYLIASPVVGGASLALMVASLFLFESISDIAMFLRLRAINGSIWVLLDGIFTLILGLMSYMRWPSTAAWAIGVLVSVSLVTSGLTRVMFSMAVRKSITLGPGRTKQDDSSAKDYWSVHE
jgi:uncharacterized membrane protein HdeD (DUF308 family)